MALKPTNPKTYTVRRMLHDTLGETTAHDSVSWEQAHALHDFVFPWEPEKPSAAITFRALHDDHGLYWQFRVRDKDIKTYVDKNEKSEVIFGDRVEIFFSPDTTLSTYYCLEIDSLARVYDYRANYYRKFDSAWQWPSGQLQVQARLDENGYVVTGRIGLQSLKDLGLLTHGTLRCGLYRGKCMKIDLQQEAMQWISWVTPASATPDFHIPSSFGIFQLE
ncbi:Carbohydrate family 9 binding domain-like [Chryseolinea serpens]|uniref:Carbohydrate family 9 binding domain-like n=1 Tax=Chryseolinea serpens TaxID=947013 RepID=A0A1M5MAV9_9BACT|nr:Carbohydrate family 9 binding domain-like [Chryseolinea serpens]